MKYKITDIIDWDLDRHMMDGDCSHMPDIEVDRLRIDEYDNKIENGNWPGLPFICDAEDEEDAIEQYNQEHCNYDYYKASEAEFEDNLEAEPMEVKQLLVYFDSNTWFRIVDEDGKAIFVYGEDYLDEEDFTMDMVADVMYRKVKNISREEWDVPANTKKGVGKTQVVRIDLFGKEKKGEEG